MQRQKLAGFCITDSNTIRFGDRVRNSFLYFHKDLDFFQCTPETINTIINNFDWPIRDDGQKLNLNQARIQIILSIKEKYKYDGIFMFDGDTVITGRLDEMINGNHNIYGSLNVKSFHGNDYLNLGVTGFKSNNFLQYFATKLKQKDMYDKYKNEQLIFNVLCGTLERDKYIFKNKPFDLNIVDRDKVYYNERSRQFWKEMTIKDDQLTCNNRVVKVLHWAGGGKDFHINKKSHPDFSHKVRRFLNRITNTKDF